MIEVTWAKLKEFVDTRNISIQYIDDGSTYHLIAIDESFQLSHTMSKHTDNESDVTDFETNYKTFGNKKLSLRDSAYLFKDLVLTATGSRNMNVTGSLASPVIFEFVPQAGEKWDIERLLFGIDDVGLTDMTLFGGIGTLTNGLLISIKSKGQSFNVGTIKDNVDIAMIFPGQPLGQSGALDTSDGYYGSLLFGTSIHLNGDRGDFVRISVRDDLRSINILRSMVVARKVL